MPQIRIVALEPFDIHILGCGSALPTLCHNATSQIVDIRGKLFMIDCAEGTQVQLRKYHININRICAVFISHLHGDHCFGLIGMISSFGMLGRTAPIHIYATHEFGDIFRPQLDFFCKGLEFEVVIHEIDTTRMDVIYDDKSVSVTTIPLEHRIPCCGFLFNEKQLRPHILRDMIDFYNIPTSQIDNIKNGCPWVTEDGRVIPATDLTIPAGKPRSYAYCSDTKYIPDLGERLYGVDVLFHESTYITDNIDRAGLYYHSTAKQAAMVAKQANAGKLLLGHYSARYSDENVFLTEARMVFDNVHLTHEGDVFRIESEEEVKGG